MKPRYLSCLRSVCHPCPRRSYRLFFQWGMHIRPDEWSLKPTRHRIILLFDKTVALSEMERSSGVGPVLDQGYETGHRLTRLMSLIARDMNN